MSEGERESGGEEEVRLDPVVTVSRITALEMLTRQLMIIQLRILNELGHIQLTPEYVKNLSAIYTEKVDESKIIDSTSPDVNYEFKVNVIHNLERFFDEIVDHVKRNP
jgi:hypothetical protein